MSDDSKETTDNVIEFPIQEIYTTEKIPVQNVFNGIQESNLETVVAIGWDDKGEEYFASSTPNGMEIVWLLERMKYRVLKEVDNI